MYESPVGIQLLKEWTIWLVGIQTSALGLLSFTAGKQHPYPFDKKWLRSAIIAFTLSILTASWTLSALPEMISRLPSPNADFHNIRMFRLFPVPLWVATSAQHWFFMIGIIFFALAVISKINKIEK